MAVVRTSVTAAMVSSTAGITVTFGTGAAAGNLAVLILETANQTAGSPSGFSVLKIGSGIGTPAGIGATHIEIYYKVGITSGDITGGIAVADSGDHTNGVLLTYSGVDISRLVQAAGVNDQSPATTAALSGTLGIGDIMVGDIALACFATDRDSATVSTNASPVWSNVAGSNSFPVNGSSSNGAGGGIIVNELIPSGPATGSVQFSATVTSTIMESFMFVLRPFVSPPPLVFPMQALLAR